VSVCEDGGIANRMLYQICKITVAENYITIYYILLVTRFFTSVKKYIDLCALSLVVEHLLKD